MNAVMLIDLDGVLVDSEPLFRITLAAVATASLGYRVTVADLPQDAATTPRVQVLTALGVEDADEACARWWDAALAAASSSGIPMIPGVVDGLAACRAAGIATGLVTLQARKRLAWLLPPHVLALLDSTVCREDAAPKPSPDGLLLSLAQLNADPDEALFVGDTCEDIAAALAAGITPIGVGWGYADPTALAAAGATAVLTDPANVNPALLDLTPNGLARLRRAARSR